jgi:integrase
MFSPSRSPQYLDSDRHADDKKTAFSKTAFRKLLAVIGPSQNQSIYLRDGEVVVYRRSRSLLYQCRYKLSGGSWQRQSTGKASVEQAIARACEIYDEARFRQRLGLAHRTHTTAQICAETCSQLRREIDGKGKKTALNDYLSIIERYFAPYFGDKGLEQITHTDIREFELWRDRQMMRRPKTSTLNNFTSAWSRVVGLAVERGYISERVPVPKLTSRGVKGKTRPAFSAEEVAQLFAFMDGWQLGGRLGVEREIRPLLRDYIEMLLYTGMRHGTEAMGIRWSNVEWHTKDGVRYLRIWVDGKTGGRWLIAKHSAVDVLRRLHVRQEDISAMSFETLFEVRVPQLLFRFSDGYQPQSFVGTFRRLMRDSGLLLSNDGQARTLYSFRHTYATLELLGKGTDIHTLSRQMGNSAAMIERHYSKLTATMAAERLA